VDWLDDVLNVSGDARLEHEENRSNSPTPLRALLDAGLKHDFDAAMTRLTQPNQPGLSGGPETVVDPKIWFEVREQICDVVKRFLRRPLGGCLYLVRRENEL
jgi:hypothetical protein